jgi:hypothetical protein
MVETVVTLRIFLMGLVALVPSENPKALTVVLPNATSHQHVPVLVWDPHNSGEAGDGAEIKKQLSLAEAPNGYLLHGQEIALARDEGPALSFTGGVSGRANRRLLPAMPRARDAGDFSWVLSMEQLTDGGGQISKEYYGRDPGMVAGRMTLEHGTVKTFGFADTNGAVRAMRFVGMGRGSLRTTRQAVADVAVVEVKYSGWKQGDEVVFELTSLRNGADKQEIHLAADDKGEINVLLGNLSPLSCAALEQPSPAAHFDLYYSLLAHPRDCAGRQLPQLGRAMSGRDVDPGLDRLPTVLQVVSKSACGGDNKGGIARPICMITSFQPPQQ